MEEIILIDVGASGGIHPRWAKAHLPVKAVLFEPDPREYNRLKAEVGDDYIVLNSALSDRTEEIEFNLCRDQWKSSVYKPKLDTISRYYTTLESFDVVDIVTVKADTLDNQLQKANIPDIDFIKLDVQGHELPILKGGSNILDSVIGVETEVEFIPFYEDQPVFTDVDIFMRENGFEMFDLNRSFRNRGGQKKYANRYGQLVWADALYFRMPEHIVTMPNISEAKISRAINVFLAYGYPDSADVLLSLAKEKNLLSPQVSSNMTALLTQYEIKKLNILPRFKGSHRVYRLLKVKNLPTFFQKLAKLFAEDRRIEKYVDGELGNPK